MTTASVKAPAAAATSVRMISLDVLRGITIAFMILVNNNGGHAWWPFDHSAWNGWTPTDLVFPTFLFLVGVTIVFSLESRLSRQAPPSAIVGKVVRRFVILFLFGLFVNGFPFFHWHTLRIYGVLQRIAICYLICSLIYLALRNSARRVPILLSLLAVCLLGYWILMRWVPVPGYGVPGRDIPLLDHDRNLVAWLDRHVLPARRLYEGTRDPEGLLSDLPSIATTLLGMLTALWLRTTRTIGQKCTGLLAAGVSLILLGKLWNIWFPINKKLWTSSYVLFAAGCSLLLWSLVMWITEIRGWRRGTGFWLIFGMNAIAAYVFSEMLGALAYVVAVPDGPGRHAGLGLWCYERLYTVIQTPGNASLVYSILFVLVCWVPMLFLYRRKIFLKI